MALAPRQDTIRSVVRTTVLIAILAGAYVMLPLRGQSWWIGAVAGIVIVLATMPVMVYHLRVLLVSAHPVVDAMQAMFLLLTMLIVGFSAVYFGMDHDQAQFSGLDTRTDAVYFTVSTLATVGFGDIVATSQPARLVVTAQILFNLVAVGLAVRVFAGVATRGSRPPQTPP